MASFNMQVQVQAEAQVPGAQVQALAEVQNNTISLYARTLMYTSIGITGQKGFITNHCNCIIVHSVVKIALS